MREKEASRAKLRLLDIRWPHCTQRSRALLASSRSISPQPHQNMLQKRGKDLDWQRATMATISEQQAVEVTTFYFTLQLT
jgi:hypothetical protein